MRSDHLSKHIKTHYKSSRSQLDLMDMSIKEEKDLEGQVAELGHLEGSTSDMGGGLSQSPEPSSDSCGEDDSGDEEKMMITISEIADIGGENSN